MFFYQVVVFHRKMCLITDIGPKQRETQVAGSEWTKTHQAASWCHAWIAGFSFTVSICLSSEGAGFILEREAFLMLVQLHRNRPTTAVSQAHTGAPQTMYVPRCTLRLLGLNWSCVLPQSHNSKYPLQSYLEECIPIISQNIIFVCGKYNPCFKTVMLLE